MKIPKYLRQAKSFLIVGLIALLQWPSLKAQTVEKDPRELVSFGVKAGLNYANVWDAQGQDFRANSRFGFAGGIFLGIPFGKTFGFQPECLVSQKGFQGTGTLFEAPCSFSRTSTYLDFPLQLQLKPTIYTTILFGPQYSYLLNVKNVYSNGINSYAQEQEFKNDNIRKNTLGFVAGADINVKHVVISGRIGWDFLSNNGDGTTSTPRYKNRWIQFTLGYKV